MQSRIRTFGVAGALPFSIMEDGANQAIKVRRELWFDRDIDGRWLVCAVRLRDDAHNGEADQLDDVGAIVVADPRVSAFINMLAQLVTDPAQFRDEPRLGDSLHQA